jgi:hypothetical protein
MKKIGIVLFVVVFYGRLLSVPIVPLTVTERAGVDRLNEPVLTGVPLPESLYVDTAVFCLKDESGQVVPCEFRTAAKWWRDKTSIRWLHLDFQTSIAAGREKTFVLHHEPASHAVTGSRLTVTDLGAKYQVDTGPLRFTVKKTGFNLFDEVWVDESGSQTFDAAHQIVSAHTGGFSLLSGTTRYSASNDAASTAVVERLGPMACVIKVEGRLKNSAGTPEFFFQARIYAYNNSKIVKVVFSFENRNSDVSTFVPMHGLNLALPLALSQKQYALGDRAGARTGALSAGDTAWLVVNGIEDYQYGGVFNDSGSTRLHKSVDMGWAACSDGQKGAGVSMRWFWQNYPSSVELDGGGMLNMGLFSHRYRGRSNVTNYPPRFPNYYRIYAGMSKSHEIRFVFFNDDSTAEARSQLVGAESRLYAFAPAEWYCRGTHAYGKVLVKWDSTLYTVAQWNQVKQYETSLQNGGLKCLGNTNVNIGGKDAYDYFGWGDNPHQYFGSGNLMWNGNYYDLPHIFWHHFVRTLDVRFLDYAEAHVSHIRAHVSHIRDMHTVHFEPADWKDGGNRYCPPTNHIGADSPSPNVQDHTSHHKTQSLWEKYYLTGDDRALDVAFKGLKRIKRGGTGLSTNVYSGNLYWYARRPAHCLFTLTMGYKHTLGSQDLSTILAHYNAIKPQLLSDPEPGTNWLIGLLTEALVDVYEITGDTDVVATIKITNDKVRNPSANSAHSLAFLARYYNNLAYLSRAYSAMASIGNGVSSFTHHEGDYSVSCHSLARAFYYFAIPDSAQNQNVDLGISAERRPDRSTPAIAVYPNPFHATVTVKLQPSARPVKISLYDVAGRLIRTYSHEKGGRIVCRLGDVPKGVYFLKIRAGKIRYSRKILHL